MRPSHLTHGASNIYLRHYCQQYGGGMFPVYAGAPYQSGAGLGDIFRMIARFAFPILAPAAKSFIQNTAQGLSEGKNIKEAAKGSLAPALDQALTATSNRIMGRQTGSGRRRRKGTLKKRKLAALFKSLHQSGGGRRRKSPKKSRKRSKGTRHPRQRLLSTLNF